MNKLKNKMIFRYLLYTFLILLFLFIVIFVILPGHLYKDNPVDADVMIVEGWLPDYALETAIIKYYSGEYRLLVTTGNPMPDEFKMGYGGSLIFNLGWLKSKYKNKRIYSIKIDARGTRADKEFPCFNVFLNDSAIGSYFVKRRNNEYAFTVDKYLYDIDTLKIDFINDTYTKWRDRNLIVSSVTIEDIKIPAYSHCIFYDINNRERVQEYEPGFTNYADYSAFVIKYLGFKDSIVAIPALKSRINRTYTSALAFEEWFKNSPFKGKSVNIVSLGPHSRRTWIIYKKLLGKDIDVGIIMVNSDFYNKNNWYKSLIGVKVTINEMASYIYTLIAFPFFRKELNK